MDSSSKAYPRAFLRFFLSLDDKGFSLENSKSFLNIYKFKEIFIMSLNPGYFEEEIFRED
jgi:hypothetical protein